MYIDETDPGAMEVLLKTALIQLRAMSRLTISAQDSFDLGGYLLYLINSPRFPLAVDPLLIVSDNDEDKMIRAEGILSVVVTQPVTDSTFLDLGCGEGHVAAQAALTAKLSVGYDIVPQEWDRYPAKDNLVFTDAWDQVVAKAPYDAILLYDVLDHVTTEYPSNVLERAKTVLKPSGRVYVRFHPWCSRHGTHLYRQLNKAYIHMFFTEKQLAEMGYHGIPTVKIIQPLQTYASWLSKTGFKVIGQADVVREPIEDFFMQPHFANMIKAHWKNSPDTDLATGAKFPTIPTAVQFVNYVLSL